MRLIRNETNTVPFELITWQVPVTGDLHLSLYGQSSGEVFDNIFMSMWEVGAVRGIEFQHRDAILEIMENDPKAIWMSMPHPAPTGKQKSPQPFLSPGDQHDMSAIENCTCYPIRLAIYEGEDGPLETAPDPHRKSMNAVDFVKAGRPGMVVGKIGKKE